MQRIIQLSSKLVRSAAYDAETMTLTVELQVSGTRTFLRVPPEVFENLVSATSPGWYYTRHIRNAYKRPEEGGYARLVSAVLKPRRTRKSSGPRA